MWVKHPFFKYSTAIILILIGIFFLKILNFFEPVKTVIGSIFYPILIAGFLYYILKPFVHMVAKIKYIPKAVAILMVYAGIAGIIYAASLLLAETIKKQVSKLTKNLPQDLKKTAEKTQQTIEQNDMGMISISSLRQKAASFSGDMVKQLGDNITEILGTLTGAATVLILVPFVLFYFLKDDHRFIPFMLRFLPEKHEGEGKKVLKNIDETLAAYIIGQITVAVVDGILMYIGYLIIGLDYALVLGIFVILTAVVPFFGPMIGVLPAIVVALTQQPMMVVYVLIILAVVQQLEGNLVAPVVLGNRLSVHPLTIILLLLVAFALYGFIGMLIAIPVYSVLKVTLKNLYDFYQLRTTNM
ncbi:AI-2E family transporter [Thalassobacillus devorans]|uniref:AI-2E family transporter n=1 Tax=Thalassobacillus devorans TaxID=279813 RepID=UPI000492107E|nr:AI-2E family transporter [Thalassobacillus devorans]